MSKTNFRLALQGYVEIKHSNWFKLVIEIVTYNQNALFQYSTVTLS